ncbi:hypothetical protein ACFVH0_33950 [Streptomyces sp. NPDC127117]
MPGFAACSAPSVARRRAVRVALLSVPAAYGDGEDAADSGQDLGSSGY